MARVITANELLEVALSGACKEAMRRYRVGQPLEDVSAEHLQWIEERIPAFARELAEELSAPLRINGVLLRGTIPLCLHGSGSGYGSGYGDGDGSGYGDGDGYGSGSGYGDGDGYGDGSGYGYGDGYGYGYGLELPAIQEEAALPMR